MEFEIFDLSGSLVPAEDVFTFLGLPADSFDDRDSQAGSAMRQEFTAEAGDVLRFDWNFLTNEFPNTELWNDFAFWSLVNLNSGIVLADTFSPLVASPAGSFTSHTGYSTISFPITTSGSTDGRKCRQCIRSWTGSRKKPTGS